MSEPTTTGPQRQPGAQGAGGATRMPVGCGPIGCMYGAVGVFVVLLIMMLIMALLRTGAMQTAQ